MSAAPVAGEWSLAWDDGAGTRGWVRLVVPGGGARCTYEAVLAAPGLGAGVFVVRDDDVAPPRGRLLEVRADGLWAELVREVPGEHWGFGLEAFGLRVGSWAEAATATVGDRVAVGLDLEWEVDPAPDPRPAAGEPLAGTLRGVLLVGHARSAVECDATFTERARS